MLNLDFQRSPWPLSQAVEVLKDCHHLGAVEPTMLNLCLLSLLAVEVADTSVVSEEIPTFEELSHEVDVSVVLKESVIFQLYERLGVGNAYNEGVLKFLKNVFLVLDVVDMLGFDNFHLFHGLDCVFVILLVFMPSYADVSKCPYNSQICSAEEGVSLV